MSDTLDVVIRPARPEDAATIERFVRELAEYEKLLHAVTATQADFETALFGDDPRAFCDIAEIEGADGAAEPVGFALWYNTFSTFVGRHGIYLEDLYVRPEARGRGIGTKLLATLAGRCVENGWYRLEWAVLDWNEPARRFYGSIGAKEMDDWIVNRVSGPALPALAGM